VKADRLFSLLGMVVIGAMVTDLISQPNVWDIELGPLQRWSVPPKYPNSTVAVVSSIGNTFTESLRSVTHG
jgi:hypothetical protein